MTIIDRYILRALLGPLGFFALVLTGVVWLTQSLRVIDIVIANGAGARVFLEFSALLLPAVLAIVLQLGALAATVLTLTRLIGDSEIIAAFAGGASRLQVARPVAIFGVGLTLIMAINSTLLMPTSARVMRDRLAEVRGDIAAGLIRDGRFLNPAPGLTVFIREITPGGALKGVMVYDARDADRPVTYTARTGFLAEDTSTPALVLREGRAQSLQGDDRLSLLGFDSFAYDLSSFIKQNEERWVKPSERYFWELLDPAFLAQAKTEKERGKLLAEGHEQLSSPLYGLALPLIAAAILFGAAHSRRGLAGSIALALLLGLGVRVAGLGAKSALSGAPELWPLMYAPPVLATALALALLGRSAGFSGVRARAEGPRPA